MSYQHEANPQPGIPGYSYVRLLVVTAAKIKITDFRDVAPCSFGEICHLPVQEKLNGVSRFVWNISTYQPNCTSSRPSGILWHHTLSPVFEIFGLGTLDSIAMNE
jgi:hypothetical protein